MVDSRHGGVGAHRQRFNALLAEISSVLLCVLQAVLLLRPLLVLHVLYAVPGSKYLFITPLKKQNKPSSYSLTKRLGSTLITDVKHGSLLLPNGKGRPLIIQSEDYSLPQISAVS